jgi:hypothetical protein
MEKIIKFIIRSQISILMSFMRLTIFVVGGLRLFPDHNEFIFFLSFCIVAIILVIDSQFTTNVINSQNGFYTNLRLLFPKAIVSICIAGLLTFCTISIIFDIRSIEELGKFLKESDNLQIGFWMLAFFLVFESTDIVSKRWLNKKETIIESKNDELSIAHTTQIRIINSIQHELGNKLPIVHLGFQDLKNVIFKLNADGEIDIDKPIREPIGNETFESIDTIRKLLSNMDTGMMNSIIVVENMKSIIRTDSESVQLTDTDINEFIRSDLDQRMSQFNNVKFHSPTISSQGFRHKIDQKQMKILLDNIYSNAQAHSFVDKDIQYDFWISLFDRKKEVEIVFQTNGNPFPNDISVEKYTEFNYFSGPNGHSGIGGYLIGQVVNNHKGKISLKPRNELRPSETSITITLPKQEK